MSNPSTPEKKPQVVPIWVAVAGLALAIVVAILIAIQIAAPLSELVFGTRTDIPVPDGAKLQSENKNAGRAQHEWLYVLPNAEGCSVAAYYQAKGATCAYTPFACEIIPEVGEIRQIATCSKSEKGLIDGYSWEVMISVEHEADETTSVYFRVYLYD